MQNLSVKQDLHPTPENKEEEKRQLIEEDRSSCSDFIWIPKRLVH